MMFPLCRGTAGPLSVMRLPISEAIHQPRESGSAAVPLPINLSPEETSVMLTLRECAIVPFMCPFVPYIVQLKRSV